MFYLIKTPWWLKRLYRSCTWQMPRGNKTVYLTFDDGPHPEITPFVLEELRKYGAKATFFCIGKNVEAYPDVYRRILEEGHTVGNHTQNHLNGWSNTDAVYLDNVEQAAKHISSVLFRPPYGRIRLSQLRKMSGYKVIMWSVLSGDFDIRIDGAQCLANILRYAEDGSIVVFHDSEKAAVRMKYALSEVLKTFTGRGFRFDAIV